MGTLVQCNTVFLLLVVVFVVVVTDREMIGFEIPVGHVDYIKVRGFVAGILKAKSPIMIILE